MKPRARYSTIAGAMTLALVLTPLGGCGPEGAPPEGAAGAEGPEQFDLSDATELQELLRGAEGAEGDALSEDGTRSASSVSLLARVFSIARTYLGVRYYLGGTYQCDNWRAYGGIDCSCLTRLAYRFATGGRIMLPDPPGYQWRYGTYVSTPRIGDLVFYKEGHNYISHVGIYAGRNFYGVPLVLHASSYYGRTVISALRWPGDGYIGARRLISLAGGTGGGKCKWGNGYYCGGNGVSGYSRNLYRCVDGKVTLAEICTDCVRKAAGQADRCSRKPCPYGDGYYCGGNQIGGASNMLYHCSSGAVRYLRTCPSKCVRTAPGRADHCT